MNTAVSSGAILSVHVSGRCDVRLRGGLLTRKCRCGQNEGPQAGACTVASVLDPRKKADQQAAPDRRLSRDNPGGHPGGQSRSRDPGDASAMSSWIGGLFTASPGPSPAARRRSSAQAPTAPSQGSPLASAQSRPQLASATLHGSTRATLRACDAHLGVCARYSVWRAGRSTRIIPRSPRQSTPDRPPRHQRGSLARDGARSCAGIRRSMLGVARVTIPRTGAPRWHSDDPHAALSPPPTPTRTA